MSASTPPSTWPADVIHVNEDGWVLINRGRANGIVPGLRIFVVGNGTRELRDLFTSDARAEAPVVLRTRRTYELLEIIHVEERCAVAIATRTPVARRPQFYTGPSGELLVWVPLPEGYTWPQPADAATDADDADADDADVEENDDDKGDEDQETAGDGNGASDASTDTPDADAASTDDVDTPPEQGAQEDIRWEEALPLNGVSVGDVVILAVPVVPAADATGANAAPAGDASAGQGSPGAWDKPYDWMPPKPE